MRLLPLGRDEALRVDALLEDEPTRPRCPQANACDATGVLTRAASHAHLPSEIIRSISLPTSAPLVRGLRLSGWHHAGDSTRWRRSRLCSATPISRRRSRARSSSRARLPRKGRAPTFTAPPPRSSTRAVMAVMVTSPADLVALLLAAAACAEASRCYSPRRGYHSQSIVSPVYDAAVRGASRRDVSDGGADAVRRPVAEGGRADPRKLRFRVHQRHLSPRRVRRRLLRNRPPRAGRNARDGREGGEEYDGACSLLAPRLVQRRGRSLSITTAHPELATPLAMAAGTLAFDDPKYFLEAPAVDLWKLQELAEEALKIPELSHKLTVTERRRRRMVLRQGACADAAWARFLPARSLATTCASGGGSSS